MVDVLVTPGAPGPWLVQQKKNAALNPVLSSKEALSRLNLDNFLFIDGSPMQSSVHCHSPVDSAKHPQDHSQPSQKRRQLHWQSPRNMNTQTRWLPSTTTDKVMASRQVSLGYDYGYSEKVILHETPTISSSFQNQSASNSYPLTAPIMKTTHSSSGIPVSVQPAPGSMDSLGKVFTTVKIDGCQELQSIAGSEPNWPSETPPSFGSGTESSPSLSSSFEILDVPKEDPVPYGLPLSDGAFMGHPPNKSLMSESPDTPFLENGLPNTSFQWSVSTENESWHSPYHSDALAWSAPAPMTSSSWPMPENTGVICPDTQLVAPYSFTYNSLLSPHNNTSIRSAPLPDVPSYSSITPLGMGTSQTHTANILPRYSGLPSVPNYSASFPESSTTYPELLQQEPDNPAIKANLHYSDTRNALLIKWKRAGLSYKDIKRIGGFKEAESTLRGRFRTLTKAKEHRVRKPKWLKRDVQLLCEAVAAYAEQASSPGAGYASLAQANMAIAMTGQPPKVSWKKVAQYIWSHGGSYQFGNATCKKKWCDIHGIRL